MMEELQNKVREMLEDGTISGFLGLKVTHAEPLPFLFTKENVEELKDLTVGNVRYPLSKILIKITRNFPGETLGIICRACDERSLIELFKNTQLNAEKVKTLGVACTEELQKACNCINPQPSNIIGAESKTNEYDRSDVQAIESMPHEKRFDFWSDKLGKCLKCYGCRNICPVCFCDVCTLEDHPLVNTGEIPPEVPSFHLSRAYHMVGRCVDCGLCEETCPVDIPLRVLYRRVREIVNDLFDYLPGEEKDQVSPVQLLGDGTFEMK
jgi:ferredoxin